MMKNKFFFYLFLSTAAGFSSGCQKAREAFGLNRHQPDEFTAPPRQALERPHNLDLSPPQPGARNRGQISPERQAQAALRVSFENGLSHSVSPLEKEILDTSQAAKAQENIREELAQERTGMLQEKGLVNKVLFWQKPQPEGDVIDPYAEQKRIADLPDNKPSSRPENED